MGELESIEDVLAAHDAIGYDDFDSCTCGWADGGTHEQHRAHLADAIRAHLADVAGRDDAAETAWLTYRDDLMRSQPWTDQRRLARRLRKREFIAGFRAYLQAIGHQT